MARELSKRGWAELVKLEMEKSAPREPKKKVFKPKNDLPVLDNYKGGAPDCFWAKFPVNIVQPAPPLVNALYLSLQHKQILDT